MVKQTKQERLAVYNSWVRVTENIHRMMFVYDRYHEAEWLIGKIKGYGEDLSQFSVLDFGCGVGDYGISFLEEGSNVLFYDRGIMLDVVNNRCATLGIERQRYILQGVNNEPILKGTINLAVFAEVLEHVKNPLEILKQVIDGQKTKYVFTTAYPYIQDDSHFHHKGHTVEALNQQKACAELLEAYYDYERLDGEIRLWTRKK